MGYFDGIAFGISGQLRQYPHRIDTVFDCYAVNLIRAGTFEFGAGGEAPKPVEGLPLVLVTGPGVRFRYGPGASGAWNHAYVTFAGRRVAEWIRTRLLDGLAERGYLLVPVGPEEAAFAGDFERLLGATHAWPVRHAWAVHALEGLLLRLQEVRRGLVGAAVPSQSVVHAQIAAINAEPERRWVAGALAAAAGYSNAHYRRLFAGLTGSTPGQYIRQRRMEKAAHLLRGTRTPIKAIAAACGYEDSFHFSKQFKRWRGRAPGRYRGKGEL